MSWIQRNLYFLIGSVVALVLMGLAVWFLYAKWDFNNQVMGQLNEVYSELATLNGKKPHPGYGQINNIQKAKDQRKELLAYIEKARRYFQPIPPIPDEPKLTEWDFSKALSSTIAELQREATNASVILPPNYNFSFQAQVSKVSFASGSLGPLAVQLGEVKAICHILFNAKVNSLDSICRERVSADDAAGPQTDYLTETSTTNDLAVLTPYELTFHCFSPELAAVLGGFASSPCAMVVKTINVEPAPATGTETTPGVSTYSPRYAPRTYAPQAAESAASAEGAYARRYGTLGGNTAAGRYGDRYSGGGGGNLGGVPLRTGPAVTPTPAPAYRMPYAAATASTSKALPTVLDEKPLKITLTLDLVKLLPPK